MKTIISHDVDHLTAWEHKTDLILEKHLLRSIIEWSRGYISKGEVLHRIKDIGKNKWHNLDSLTEFDKENKIPSVFFMAVSKGRGLNYNLKTAVPWIASLLNQGFEIGVHGIAYHNFRQIHDEWVQFNNYSRNLKFGIRMHYLRKNENTLNLLEECGYLYDSSVQEISAPFKKKRMWEFPLHIMDGNIFYSNSRWQNRTLSQAIDYAKRIIEEVYKKNIPFLTILFHDRYFSDSFNTWRKWYSWLIYYLKESGIEFVNYSMAIKELEQAGQSCATNGIRL